MMPPNKKFIFGISSLILLFFGIFYGHWFWPRIDRGAILREKNTSYHFISPLIGCEVSTISDFPELSSLELGLKSIIAKDLKTPDISDLSVYFRGLNSGRWLELNGDQKYRPASLLKLVTAISHFKVAEDEPGHLDRLIKYLGPQKVVGITPNVDSDISLQAGKWYSVGDLIKQLLIYSDNDANNLLIDNISPVTFQAVFDNLGLARPPSDPGLAFISPRDYSRLFRVLYGASYLNRADSEELLDILSKSSFDDGLRPGVPKNVVISHKFGIRRLADVVKTATDEQELHDCGIIYYPEHPYFLCVMTRGNNYDKLAFAIQEISKLTYRWVDNFWKN